MRDDLVRLDTKELLVFTDDRKLIGINGGRGRGGRGRSLP